MTPPRRSSSLMDRLAASVRAGYDADRRAHPERFTGAPDGLGPDFLFVENVARMLACNVDFVRRIPRQELPASKRGSRLIYQRADVEAYNRAGREDGSSRHVASRKPAVQRVAIDRVGKSTTPVTFDPISHVRALMKDVRS